MKISPEDRRQLSSWKEIADFLGGCARRDGVMDNPFINKVIAHISVHISADGQDFHAYIHNRLDYVPKQLVSELFRICLRYGSLHDMHGGIVPLYILR